MFEVVGRDEELASLLAFIDEEQAGDFALVLDGEVGIGKSTLWSAGVDQWRAQGLRALSSRPAEAEQGLALAGLGDLFEDVLDEVLPALPTPRRRALEVALLLEEADGVRADPRALGIATRGALEVLSQERPVLVAIDDIQWFDNPSTGALAFALRRLGTDRVRVLLARRLVDDARPSGLEQALDARDVRRLPVGPLTVGALHRVLRDQLDTSFARQTLLRIHERSSGKPFFALELARACATRTPAAAAAARVPRRSKRSCAQGAPGSPHQPTMGWPSPRRLARLRSRSWSARASRPLRSRLQWQRTVIEVEHGTIRFTHPLLSSVIYQISAKSG